MIDNVYNRNFCAIKAFLSNFKLNKKVTIKFGAGAFTDGKTINLPITLLEKYDRAEVLGIINHEVGHIIHSELIFNTAYVTRSLGKSNILNKTYLLNCVDDARLEFFNLYEKLFFSAHETSAYLADKYTIIGLAAAKKATQYNIEPLHLIGRLFLAVAYDMAFADKNLKSLKQEIEFLKQNLEKAVKPNVKPENIFKKIVELSEKLKANYQDPRHETSFDIVRSLLRLVGKLESKTIDNDGQDQSQDNSDKGNSNDEKDTSSKGEKKSSQDVSQDSTDNTSSESGDSNVHNDTLSEMIGDRKKTDTDNDIADEEIACLLEEREDSKIYSLEPNYEQQRLAEAKKSQFKVIYDSDSTSPITLNIEPNTDTIKGESSSYEMTAVDYALVRDKEVSDITLLPLGFVWEYNTQSAEDWEKYIRMYSKAADCDDLINRCLDAVSLFKSESYTRSARTGFRMSKSALKKIAQGDFPKEPYLRQEDMRVLSTDIAICVDVSCSMNSKRYAEVVKTLSIFAYVFEGIKTDNINVSLYAFNSRVMKCFEGVDNFTAENLATFPSACGDTDFCEPLGHAGVALNQSEYDRKAILFITDGETPERQKTRELIFLLRKAGIEVHCLQICDKNCYYNEAKELGFNTWHCVEEGKVNISDAVGDVFTNLLNESSLED